MKEKIKKISNKKEKIDCCCNSKFPTGGIILILIGVIALSHQILPIGFVWSNIGPIILIIIGIRILTRCRK